MLVSGFSILYQKYPFSNYPFKLTLVSETNLNMHASMVRPTVSSNCKDSFEANLVQKIKYIDLI